ncbi:hypothetical protein CVS29_02560 [Arthrobacter psychrochitiniphilus]|uniref:Uncharacterized protein n=1 Tax=Arthrobacter psychrochitiniphilus TaxID=291045 RepID=A0A2V3DVZ0_9MICC|nr:hypothetical protein CVS29_02560 [Arthrobacter psychrochitiniphilus]
MRGQRVDGEPTAVDTMPAGMQLNKRKSQMKAWREGLLALERRHKLLNFQHPEITDPVPRRWACPSASKCMWPR